MKSIRFLTFATLLFTNQMIAAAPLEVRIKSDYEGGVSAHEAGKIDLAIILFQQGVDKGDAKSMVALGTYYHFGEGVPKDLAKARSLYEKGSAIGSPDANTMLGIIYREGQGVPVNKQLASEYFKTAALSCSSTAQEKLAQMLFAAEGIKENKVEALAWLYIAERSQSNSEAKQGISFLENALNSNQIQSAKVRRDEIEKMLKCPS